MGHGTQTSWLQGVGENLPHAFVVIEWCFGTICTIYRGALAALILLTHLVKSLPPSPAWAPA